MSKRRADTELNQDNWDDDLPASVETDNPVQTDTVAPSARKILVPKFRRTNNTSGLFKSMSGFSNGSPAIPNFSFNSKQTEPTSFRSLPLTADANQEAEYLKELQALNSSLLNWIEKHVKSDPHCILSPVFSDYEKHLNQIHAKFPNRSSDDPAPRDVPSTLAASTTSASNAVDATPRLPGPELLPSVVSKSQTPSTLSTTVSGPDKPFSFSLPPLTSSNCLPPLFKFGTSVPTASPFTTPPVSSDHSAVLVEEEDSEEYQPPKPVVREIKEEGSVYSVRCKLFYKTQTEWRERGVGNLFIKPQSDNKFQLLVRADTNLGNILLNVMITKEIPFKLQKNNVTLVCVPTPPLPGAKPQAQEGDAAATKPSLMLIRVKTEEAASDLLKQINRYRGLTEEV